MKPLALSLLSLAFGASTLVAAPEQVTEPASGVAFDAASGDLKLLGVGLRTKTFLRVKVYAVGLYVDPAGLAAHRGKGAFPALFRDLVSGDFRREIRMKFVRSSVTADQIRGAFRESLAGADRTRVEAFLAYFGETKAGDEYVLRWLPGGVLETTVAGQAKAPIADRAFASAVFGIWLGERPIQEDIKQGLVARLAEVVR
jgi:hypothetical protein